MAENRTKADGFMLRFPEGMRERIKAAADASNRSMNSEIVARLEGGLDRDEDGAIKVWLPQELLERIYDEAHGSDLDPNLLIVDALESVFPAPVPTFGDLISGLRKAIAGRDDEPSMVAMRDYLEAAEKLIKADPKMAHRTVAIPASMKQFPWDKTR